MFPIRPCPHCGGYSVIVKANDFVYIECVSCGAKSRAEGYEEHPRLIDQTFYSAVESCIENWNERIQPVKKEPETNFEKLFGMDIDEAAAFLAADGKCESTWCCEQLSDECDSMEDCKQCCAVWLRKKVKK